MKNPVYRLKNAWFNKLSNAISINSVTIPVFREDAGKLPASHYVLIRSGGSKKEGNDNSFMRRVSLFIQIVTKFDGTELINDEIVESIEEQITQIILPDGQQSIDDALTDGTDFQITMVSNEDDSYETFIDTDQSIKYHIKTTRWEHLAVQKF